LAAPSSCFCLASSTCLIVDQAALHGVLAKIRDMNLPLISVNQIKPVSTKDQS
jgi:hypothetical protein